MARHRSAAPPARPATLTDRERRYVFSVAMKYMKDEDAAADVTQDALLLAHRHRDSFRGDARYSTWLYRVAATTALMHLRKRRRTAREIPVAPRAGAAAAANELDQPAGDSSPEEVVAAREAMAIVDRALAALGDKYRDVFRMRFVEGYTESEIARRLDLNVATVKTRAFRARLAVRRELQHHFARAA
ncbi:MAG: sigma-70 family RNA polymerase sigma factor [Deltaproteobacteria bacterium]|nr:MAG: sigma-70 family RNA polymerase sigma factor [Deltaproteobacteria bacterium]